MGRWCSGPEAPIPMSERLEVPEPARRGRARVPGKAAAPATMISPVPTSVGWAWATAAVPDVVDAVAKRSAKGATVSPGPATGAQPANEGAFACALGGRVAWGGSSTSR